MRLGIRSLIGDIVLTPGERRGEINTTLRGELMAILGIAGGGNTPRTAEPRVITNAVASPLFEPISDLTHESQLSVVASPRNHH